MIEPRMNTQSLALLGSLMYAEPASQRGAAPVAPLPSAMGHVFTLESSVAGTRCGGCGQAYAVHQHMRRPCPMPEAAARKAECGRANAAKRVWRKTK